jgi:diguanylate cyclase
LSRLQDLLLTTDPVLRARLSRVAIAMLTVAVGVVAMNYFAWVGRAPGRAVALWSLAALAGMVVFYAALRSGWSRRFPDPSLTVPQMLYAISCGAVAYALLGSGRGAVFPVLMVILMFGMFMASPQQMRWVTGYAVGVFGVAMAVSARTRPEVAPPVVELGHFLLVATMAPAVSLLAGRLAAMRLRARRQRQDLAAALVRIRELATRDELTGLVNRRHMRELMEQEHQRCIRSGRTFCLAVLDIDRFKGINEAHGRGVGDAVLRSVAHEAMRRVRVSDAFARWGGDRFVLLLADARSPLAKGGVERVRSGIGSMHVAIPAGDLRLTLSAGLAEHHAGETVDQTLDRAERALADAKQQGRDRLAGAM